MDKKEIIEFPSRRSVGLLIDPDKFGNDALINLLRVAEESKADYILVGGSLSFVSVGTIINEVRKHSTIPVILFPGNLLQINVNADVILFLSLISGRNPEFLIGNH